MPARARIGEALTSLLAAVAVTAGRLVGAGRRVLPFVPGLGGAAGFSVCLGFGVSHVFGHGLAPWVAGLTGSVFALAMDRQMPLRRGRGE
jgi:hypothetical protein